MEVHLKPELNSAELPVIQITGSKSESNRLLILQDFFPSIKLKNISNSDDTLVLQKALASTEKIIDVHHAGTAMRFLTAYFTIKEGREVILTGSERMKERPISILVKALRKLGADIEYLENEGFPPLRIRGKAITQNKVSLQANISSQYISALLLIAPMTPSGLTISLEEEITSKPYLEMTLSLLHKIGVKTTFSNNQIQIFPLEKVSEEIEISIESDWSSASYFYSLVALSEKSKVQLSTYKLQSLQGDSVLAEFYKRFGVKTSFKNNSIVIEKQGEGFSDEVFKADMSNCPDLAQTIAVTCLGLGIGCKLSGLHTLKIKETDRLTALKNEMEKLGAAVEITKNSLSLKPINELNSGVEIATYNDHRMAMAFAPLASKIPLTIQNATVVSKSFPSFWENLQQTGILVTASL